MFSKVSLVTLMMLATLAVVPGAEAQHRDPFRPPAGATASDTAPARAAEPLVLQGTRVAQGQRVALINGRQYVTGERLGGVRIVEIAPARVRLRDAQGRDTLLHLGAQGINRKPAEP